MKNYEYIQNIIDILPGYDAAACGLTVSQIANRLGLSNSVAGIRRIQRYMRVIEERHPRNLCVTAISRAHYFSWNGTRKQTTDSRMALGLLMLERHQTLLPRSIRVALGEQHDLCRDQLAALAKKNPQWDYRHWIDKVRMLPDNSPLQPAQVHADVERAIENSILKNRVISILYGEQAEWLKVHPIGLVHKGARIYLTALEHRGDQIKHFCLHRILNAFVESETCRTPSVSIDELISRGVYGWYAGEQPLPLDLKVSAHYFRRVLSETPLIDQTVEPLSDGYYRVKAFATDCMDLRHWLLSNAADIQVMGPSIIRESICDSLQQAMLAYAA